MVDNCSKRNSNWEIPSLLYCISRKNVYTEYMYYSWCMTSTDIVKWRKNEWLWKFRKRNDLYENLEKRGVVEKRGEEETKSITQPLHSVLLVITKLLVSLKSIEKQKMSYLFHSYLFKFLFSNIYIFFFPIIRNNWFSI